MARRTQVRDESQRGTAQSPRLPVGQSPRPSPSIPPRNDTNLPIPLFDSRTPLEIRGNVPPARRPQGGLVWTGTVLNPNRAPWKPGPHDFYETTADAKKRYLNLSPDEFNKITDMMDKWYGGPNRWEPSYIRGFYEQAVDQAEYVLRTTGMRMTVIEAFDDMLGKLAATGQLRGMRRGRGGGAGFGGTTRDRSVSTFIDDQEFVDLTNPSNARMFLEDAIQDYLGRRPSGEEYETFLSSLNASERATPRRETGTRTVVQDGTATRTRAGTTSESMQQTTSRGEREGGVAPQQLAREFARSREGAAETAVSTRGINAFLELLGSL